MWSSIAVNFVSGLLPPISEIVENKTIVEVNVYYLLKSKKNDFIIDFEAKPTPRIMMEELTFVLWKYKDLI